MEEGELLLLMDGVVMTIEGNLRVDTVKEDQDTTHTLLLPHNNQLASTQLTTLTILEAVSLALNPRHLYQGLTVTDPLDKL